LTVRIVGTERIERGGGPVPSKSANVKGGKAAAKKK